MQAVMHEEVSRLKFISLNQNQKFKAVTYTKQCSKESGSRSLGLFNAQVFYRVLIRNQTTSGSLGNASTMTTKMMFDGSKDDHIPFWWAVIPETL
jgi:hypothetical protein